MILLLIIIGSFHPRFHPTLPASSRMIQSKLNCYADDKVKSKTFQQSWGNNSKKWCNLDRFRTTPPPQPPTPPTNIFSNQWYVTRNKGIMIQSGQFLNTTKIPLFPLINSFWYIMSKYRKKESFVTANNLQVVLDVLSLKTIFLFC